MEFDAVDAEILAKRERLFNEVAGPRELNEALKLIKRHITEEETEQNRDLHAAVQLVVKVARVHGLLTQ